MLGHRLLHEHDTMHVVRHELHSHESNLRVMITNFPPAIQYPAAQFAWMNPSLGMFVIMSTKLSQDGFTVLDNKGYHIDATTTVVVTCLAPFHGPVGLKIRVLLEPLPALLIAVIFHITKVV